MQPAQPALDENDSDSHPNPKGDMSQLNQQTLNQVVHATGVGLHSGRQVVMTLRPSEPDTGIRFVRTDLDEMVSIAARSANVGDTTMATSLCAQGAEIRTIEHLMSAFAGLGIDNAIVEVPADELPIMDGSAAPFVFLLQAAGIVPQPVLKRFLRVTRPLRCEDGDAWVSLAPYDGFHLEYTLSYEHPVFERAQNHSAVEFSTTSYVREVARARTFGFLADYERLRAAGLVRGGSLQNAVVLDDEQVLNDGGLRSRDELTKHKILDAIGDLYLTGHSVIGAFRGYKSGHRLNCALVNRLLDTPDAFEFVTFEDAAQAPVGYLAPALAAA